MKSSHKIIKQHRIFAEDNNDCINLDHSNDETTYPVNTQHDDVRLLNIRFEKKNKQLNHIQVKVSFLKNSLKYDQWKRTSYVEVMLRSRNTGKNT